MMGMYEAAAGPQEIRTPLLAEEEEEQRPVALTNDFFMHRFKTLWCPVGVQHDWQTCVYAHNYQARLSTRYVFLCVLCLVRLPFGVLSIVYIRFHVFLILQETRLATP